MDMKYFEHDTEWKLGGVQRINMEKNKIVCQ